MLQHQYKAGHLKQNSVKETVSKLASEIVVFKNSTETTKMKVIKHWPSASCSNLQAFGFLVEGSMHWETDPLHIVEPEIKKKYLKHTVQGRDTMVYAGQHLSLTKCK